MEDHIIINESSYYSFADSGLIEELRESTRYVPAYILVQRHKAEIVKNTEEKAKKEIKKEMAKSLIEKGVNLEIIETTTGLSKSVIKRLKGKGE